MHFFSLLQCTSPQKTDNCSQIFDFLNSLDKAIVDPGLWERYEVILGRCFQTTLLILAVHKEIVMRVSWWGNLADSYCMEQRFSVFNWSVHCSTEMNGFYFYEKNKMAVGAVMWWASNVYCLCFHEWTIKHLSAICLLYNVEVFVKSWHILLVRRRQLIINKLNFRPWRWC